LGTYHDAGFIRALSTQLSPKIPIRLNGLAPNWTDTAIIQLPTKVFEDMGIKFQTAADVARSVGLLAVDEKRHGQVIYSIGGQFKEIDDEVMKATDAALGGETGLGPEDMAKVLERATQIAKKTAGA